ncbi:hypothetical protein ACFWA4_27080 [Streptomyces sp. NPDC060011]|uniref:hypothetical protein n=1 Tax=Streptomyces sp. NPDC060011 TaxID=3347037 RepID=UPI0036A5C641
MTPGQRHNSTCARPLLERIRVPCVGPGRPRRRPDQVVADKTPHAAVYTLADRLGHADPAFTLRKYVHRVVGAGSKVRIAVRSAYTRAV